MVGLLRLTAIVPFTVMNYGLGLSKIRFKHYILASWIGMIPGTLLNVYLGSLAGTLVLQEKNRQKYWIEWVFFALGIVVTLGMGIYATSKVKRALNELP